MNKAVQTFLLIVAVSLGVALRMSIFGWFFIIGIATILIFGISHLLIHNYGQTYLAKNKFSSYALIFLSHLLFISIFLFQVDADDARSYSIIGFVTNGENHAFTNYGFSIVLLSVIGYTILGYIIINRAKKEKLIKFSPLKFSISIISSIILAFVFLQLLYANKNIQYSKEINQKGEYNSIESALKEPEKVIFLKINAYETRITKIPKEVFQFPNLKEIDLTDQNISTIPNEISQANNLEILNLLGNNIHEIPIQLCECKKLRELRIGGDIKRFPECIKTMKSLKHLSIESNSVNQLMDELLTFKNLETAHFYLKDGILNVMKLDSIYNVTGIKHSY